MPSKLPVLKTEGPLDNMSIETPDNKTDSLATIEAEEADKSTEEPADTDTEPLVDSTEIEPPSPD
jgi:hypothetical protein